MLPNFVIIGAMKGGTTSLYHYLRSHPQVFMSATKELHYFVAEKNLPRGRSWYEQQFAAAGDAVAVGEASPDYSKYPLHEGVAERMAALIPSARLIYSVRNPVERIRSHYLHDVARGRERRPITEAVPGNLHYLAPSRYALQIDQYLDHFPREHLLVVTSENLRADRDGVLREIHEFLGVDVSWSAPGQDQEFNATGDKNAPGLLVRMARGVPGASRLRLRYPRQVTAVEALLRRPGRRIDLRQGGMPPDLRARLVEDLAPDLERLRKHLGSGFNAWGLI